MDKPTRAPAKKAAKPPVGLQAAAPPAAAHDPPKLSAVDIEAFSRNVARLIEEGGKALAAYMKPREQGKIKADAGEDIADALTSGRSPNTGCPTRNARWNCRRASAAPISIYGPAWPSA